jgi:hypothetical protein
MKPDLKPLGFELAYLAMLTKAGLKPLSRWEAGINEVQCHCLIEYGLNVRKIRRIARSKLEVFETIFSNSRDCLDKYTELFNDKPLGSTRATVLAEGYLFGYPSCCIESFIKNGYRENGLNKTDQNILFHWACCDCVATKILLPHYRRVYNECLNLFDLRSNHDVGIDYGSIPTSKKDNRRKTYHFTTIKSKRFQAILPIFTSLFLACGLRAGNDSHLPPIDPYEDSDADYLTDTEEGILGSNPNNPDEDGNKVYDGIDLAKKLYDLIKRLPDTPSSNTVYAIPHMAFGLESCSICGEQVNMGALQIVNPLENYEIYLPFIAIHYLEHGAFTYSGSIHNGKVKPPVLKTILQSNGLTHFIKETVEKDRDNDGLLDYEEKLFKTSSDNPDTDENNIRDGIQIAREFLQRLKNLPRAADIDSGPKDRPFVVEHPMDGIETCPLCGDSVVMDWWLVYNPVNKLQISIPSMALHYMEHCGFRWEGGQMFNGSGRVSAKQLKAVLDNSENGHIVGISGDFDEDGIRDEDEASFLLCPQNPDTDENGIKDGADLAKTYWQLISKLPRTETNGTFVIEHPMRGFVYCPICANTVNMGYIEIINKERNINWQVSYLRLHFLEHGSLSMPGDDYVSPLLLSELFKASVIFSSSPTGFRFTWKGESGKRYIVFYSENINGPWSVYGLYEGADKDIEINEQSNEGKKFYRILIY